MPTVNQLVRKGRKKSKIRAPKRVERMLWMPALAFILLSCLIASALSIDNDYQLIGESNNYVGLIEECHGLNSLRSKWPLILKEM